MTEGHQQSSAGSARLAALASRIAEIEPSWLPIAGHVRNVTFTLDEADLVILALTRPTAPAQSVGMREALKGLVDWFDSSMEERGSTTMARFDAARAALASQPSPAATVEKCTLCAAQESPGFYTGCMVKDGHAPERDCDGKGNLTRRAPPHSSADSVRDRLTADPRASVRNEMDINAARYLRLRVLGVAPAYTDHLKNGDVMRFTNLDEFVDKDIAWTRSRGEVIPESNVASMRSALVSAQKIIERDFPNGQLAIDIRNALSGSEPQTSGVWQPIETAPKDGSLILIGGMGSQGWFVADVKWDGAWLLWDASTDEYSEPCFACSHWMPIPAPPLSRPNRESGK